MLLNPTWPMRTRGVLPHTCLALKKGRSVCASQMSIRLSKAIRQTLCPGLQSGCFFTKYGGLREYGKVEAIRLRRQKKKEIWRNPLIDRIRDWKVQIGQSLLPLMIIPSVLVFDIPDRITDSLAKANVNTDDLNLIWRISIGLGKWPLIVVLITVFYRVIRQRNKESTLKQNLAGKVVWHTYFGYWFCCRILNYQTVSLVRVPIPVQFKLVWKDLFKEYQYGEVDELQDDDTVSVEYLNAEDYSSTVNMFLIDTYPIEDWKSKIPQSAIDYSTVTIRRTGARGVRCYSKEFVSKISVVFHELPSIVKEINVFATTNPKHVYHIVNEVFKTGGRDSTKRIRVYEQTKDSWVFNGKNIIINLSE